MAVPGVGDCLSAMQTLLSVHNAGLQKLKGGAQVVAIASTVRTFEETLSDCVVSSSERLNDVESDVDTLLSSLTAAGHSLRVAVNKLSTSARCAVRSSE